VSSSDTITALGLKIAAGVGLFAAAGALGFAVLVFAVPGYVLPLSRQQLPGLELGLPIGKTDASAAADYRVGKWRVETPLKRAIVLVRWEMGGALDDELVTLMANAMAGAMTAKEIDRDVPVSVPGGLSARSWRMTLGEGISYWGTAVVCGRRRITILTTGRALGVDRLHRRVAATLRCSPDAAREALLGDLPVIAQFPGKWSRQDSEPGQLMLSDGRFILTVNADAGKPVDQEALGKLLPGLFGEGARVGPPEDGDRKVERTVEGEKITGWFSLRHCPELNQTLLLTMLHADDPAASEAARALLRVVRCRRADEAPQQWPAASAP